MLKISNGSGKLADIQSLNTNTLTNDFCIAMHNAAAEDVICRKCYSVTMLNGLRKNCAPSWQVNSDILSGGLIPPHMLPTILQAFFRFSSHGELINMTHLENLHNITMHNPHCTFALWTKRKGFIRKFYEKNEKPAKLILIYSNPRIDRVMTEPPALFDRTFNNVSKGSDVAQNCTGQKCRDCLLCYTPNNGVKTIIEAVK